MEKIKPLRQLVKKYEDNPEAIGAQNEDFILFNIKRLMEMNITRDCDKGTIKYEIIIIDSQSAEIKKLRELYRPMHTA